MIKKIRDFYETESKSTLVVYLVLRALVIACLVLETLRGNWSNACLCVLTLILYLIPYFIDQKLKIDLPSALDIVIFLFIFSAEILGEIQNFYGVFKHWDTILHTLNGFLCAAIGFSLIDILNRSSKININLSPIFVAVVAFCFSMTVGVLWEFFEFGMDTYFRTDMQKDRVVQSISSVTLNPNHENVPIIIDNITQSSIYYYNSDGQLVSQTVEGGFLDLGIIDTMKDLLVNFVGAIVFSIFGFLYIKNRDQYHFVTHFIPRRKRT